VIRGSKKWKPPGFQGIPLFDVVQFFYKQVKTVGMSERAAAISFNFVMAIPPSLIFLFTLVPFFPINRQFEFELYNLIRSIVPGDENNGAIISFLKDFINKPRSGLLSIGFLLSLFFSSNAMIGIMRSFDKNYVGFKKRKGLQKRRDALKITLVLFFFVILCIVLLVLQGTVLKWLGVQNASVRNLLNMIRWLLIVILFFTSISYIYRNAPAVHKKWRFINPGSILAAFLMILFTVAFSWWVTNFSNYNELYGSISAILIIMLFIFFNSLVLMVGFELNVSINALKKIADERAVSTAGGKEIPA
jgi:membrane protein